MATTHKSGIALCFDIPSVTFDGLTSRYDVGTAFEAVARGYCWWPVGCEETFLALRSDVEIDHGEVVLSEHVLFCAGFVARTRAHNKAAGTFVKRRHTQRRHCALPTFVAHTVAMRNVGAGGVRGTFHMGARRFVKWRLAGRSHMAEQARLAPATSNNIASVRVLGTLHSCTARHGVVATECGVAWRRFWRA